MNSISTNNTTENNSLEMNNGKQKPIVDLTIVIPYFNKSEYITKTVESILSQTILPKKILIIDDHSLIPASTVLSEKGFSSSLIECIYLNENKGTSFAKNEGVRLSRTKYINTLDADDYFYSNKKIETEYPLAEKGDIPFSAYIRVDTNNCVVFKNHLEKRRYSKPNHQFVDFLSGYKAQFIPDNYIVAKEDFLMAGGYDVAMNLYEDLDLLLRLSKFKKFIFTKQYGLAYRITPNSLSSQKASIHRKVIKAIRQKYIPYLSRKQKVEYILKRCFVRVYRRLCIIVNTIRKR